MNTKEYNAAYYQKNREKAKAYSREYYKKNKERIDAELKIARQLDPTKQKESDARYYKKNKEAIRERQAGYRARNPDAIRRSNQKYYRANTEKVRKQSLLWVVNNRERANTARANRKARKLQATPSWANQDAIAEFYKISAGLQTSTGVRMAVDHIVPLISDYVCGLHCEHNLRVITSSENASKSNRYWPDMWEN